MKKIILVVFILIATNLFADSWDNAVKMANQGKQKEAGKIFQSMIKLGDMRGMFGIGMMMEYGYWPKESKYDHIHAYQIACENGKIEESCKRFRDAKAKLGVK